MNLSPTDRELLLTQIKRHEGLRLRAYLDTEGLLTVGYGHNCAMQPVAGVSGPGDAITREQAEGLLKQDLAAAVREVCRVLPFVEALNPPRQAVLYDMAFNLGITGLSKFKKLLAAVQDGRWERAAAEMLESRWARQVKSRAANLARQMEQGLWPE